MQTLSEKVANSYRDGSTVKPEANNKTTRKRRALYKKIMNQSHGNIGDQIAMSLNIIKQNRPLVESYVLSQNEVPLDNIEDLVKQAYELRSKEIDDTAQLLQVSEGEANIFLEADSSFQSGVNNFQGGADLGELFAPIGIAAKHLSFTGEDSEPDSFIDANLVSGVIGTIGGKLDSAQLKRAAENKPSGIVGALTGGKKEYETLRSYLQNPKNADEKAAVIKGVINSVYQLRGYSTGGITLNQGVGGVNIAGVDVIEEIARQKRREAIRKAIPFLIIGVVVIVLVTFLIVRKK